MSGTSIQCYFTSTGKISFFYKDQSCVKKGFSEDPLVNQLIEVKDCLKALEILQEAQNNCVNFNTLSARFQFFHEHTRPGYNPLCLSTYSHEVTIEYAIKILQSFKAYQGTLTYQYDKIDEKLYRIVRNLNQVAAIPIIGVIPAALKVLIGVVRIAVALFALIMALPFTCCSENARIIARRSLAHVLRGITNIVLGSIQAIPWVGMGMYYCCLSQKAPNK